MKILSKDIIFEVIFLAMIIGFPLSATDDPAKDDFNLRLAKAPQPWKTKEKLYPTQEEYEATLEYWVEKYPQLCTVEKRGESLEGLPIFLIKITDKSIADEDKYVVLITGLHVGGERAGGMAIMHAVEWLLSDDPEAVETRKKQIILVMPIVNPYGFFIKEGVNNSQGIDPYAAGRGRWWDLETLTFKEPEKSPEIMAVKSVVDEYQPEVHADFHGVALHYPGHITTESRGSAYSNFTLRPWDWRVMEAMIQAGNKAGYGYERLEADELKRRHVVVIHVRVKLVCEHKRLLGVLCVRWCVQLTERATENYPKIARPTPQRKRLPENARHRIGVTVFWSTDETAQDRDCAETVSKRTGCVMTGCCVVHVDC